MQWLCGIQGAHTQLLQNIQTFIDAQEAIDHIGNDSINLAFMYVDLWTGSIV